MQGCWRRFICFRTRREVFDNGAIYKMMSVACNYQKSFCIKYLLKFKNPTEVCQTIALIWRWKQFTEDSWPQLFKRCGWHYSLVQLLNNWGLVIEVAVSTNLLAIITISSVLHQSLKALALFRIDSEAFCCITFSKKT